MCFQVRVRMLREVRVRMLREVRKRIYCVRQPTQPEQTIRTLGFVGTRPQLAPVSKKLLPTTGTCQ